MYLLNSALLMLELCSVPRAMYAADGPVHVFAQRPPSETAAAAVSHSPAAVYSSPSTSASTPVQQHATTVSSGSVLSPDQTTSQISSAGPLMTAAQQGVFQFLQLVLHSNFCSI